MAGEADQAELPFWKLYSGDWLKDTQRLSLAARGALVDIGVCMHNSQKRGVLLTTRMGLSRILRASVEQTDVVLAELTDPTCPILTKDDISDGQLHLTWPRMVRQERKRIACKRAGKSGGSPYLRSTLKGGLKRPLNLPSGLCISSSEEESLKGETNPGGDELDREIRAYFSQHRSLMWSIRAHADIRYLVEKSGWDDAKRLIDVAIKASAGDAPSYARGVHRREQAEEAKRPKASPRGAWADRPYFPG